jgi:hypothetical protein
MAAAVSIECFYHCKKTIVKEKISTWKIFHAKDTFAEINIDSKLNLRLLEISAKITIRLWLRSHAFTTKYF